MYTKLTNRIYHFVVFLTSAVILCYEILLPKILEFLHGIGNQIEVIPIALSGMGLGGLLSYFMLKKITDDRKVFSFLLIIYPFILIFSFVFLVLFINNPIIKQMSALSPFIIGGAILSFAFLKNNANTLHFMSLSGAALGVLILLITLEAIGGENVMLLLIIIATINVILIMKYLTWKFLKVVFYLMLIILISIFLINFNQDNLNLIKILALIENEQSPSQNTSLGSSLLRNPNVNLLTSKWNLVSRIDVLYGDGLKKLIYDYNPYKHSPFIAFFNHNRYFSDVVKKDEYGDLPIPVNKKDFSVLIIGVGGGVDILTSKKSGASEIVGVEINPSIVNLMQNELAPYSDYIYKEAKIKVLDGRNYVQTTKKVFDLIIINQTDVRSLFPCLAVSMENYLYTKEAFRQYLKILKQDGMLFIGKHILLPEDEGYPFELLRLVSTIMEVLKEGGRDEPNKHLFICSSFPEKGKYSDQGYLIIKKTPFRLEEIQTFRKKMPDWIRYIYYNPYEKNQNNWFSRFIQSDDKKNFYRKYYWQIKPSTDEKPFFYARYKFKEMFDKIFRLTLYKIIILSLLPLLTLILIERKLWRKYSFSNFIYFAFSGVGYIFLEIALIQSLNIYIGNPVYSISLVLITMMVFGGLGSFCSRRNPRKYMLFSLISLTFIIIIYFYITKIIFSYCAFIEMYKRFIFAGILILPLAYFSGMPFPNALETIKKKNGDNISVSFAWIVNGLFFGLGSFLAIVLSMSIGFNNLLVISSFIYLILFVIGLVL